MEKTIKILGYDVKMRYCAATETGFEQLTGKEISVFLPQTKTVNGETVTTPPEATTMDYLSLGMAGVIAAYARSEEEPPVTMEELLYDAHPDEIVALITAICELRTSWYNMPSVIKTERPAESEESPKNA